MKLAEALKASKTREAYGLIPESLSDNPALARLMGVPIATADDYGIRYLGPGPGNNAAELITSSWVDLLPDQRKRLFALDWRPVKPKHALVQLAEALTDWSELDADGDQESVP